MAVLTIRKLDEGLKSRLRIRAAEHGRSMEEEACELLKAGLLSEPAQRLNMAESIRRIIEPLGGVELAIPSRQAIRPPTLK